MKVDSVMIIHKEYHYHLPRVWEQMTQAYEFGVREIWVTNIGDIGTQEYGLSFFLDLAYDIEKWGRRDAGITVQYTREWVEKQYSSGIATIGVEAQNREIPDNVFLESDGYIAMEASHFCNKMDVEQGAFHILSPYGRNGSAIKVFPCTRDFRNQEERPYVEYYFETTHTGLYQLWFYLAPTTPVVFEREQYIGYSVNGGTIRIVNTVKRPEIPFFASEQWGREARDNIKVVEQEILCDNGMNILRFYGMSPAIVLERIVLSDKNLELPQSYLGPKESYIKKSTFIGCSVGIGSLGREREKEMEVSDEDRSAF